MAQFTILTPFPGTRLYQKLSDEERIFSKDWSKYDAGHVVIRPRNMSVDDLNEEFETAYKTFYKRSYVWQRAMRRLFLNRQIGLSARSLWMNKMISKVVQNALPAKPVS